MHQIALGLDYLHDEGIVHGDLHAGNVLVDGNGAVRLTDFGLSLISEGTAYNYGSHHGGGAIRWSAPELFDPEEFGLDSSRPTFSSDVYAFACVCIEVCALLDCLIRYIHQWSSFTLDYLLFRTSQTVRYPYEWPEE